MSYALLEQGASYAEWLHACAAINKITFTIEDAEEGFGLIRFDKIDQSALDRFTARFQDAPAELVIASLHARFNLFAEDDVPDLKTTQPGVYRSMLTGPLTPEDFYVYDAAEA